MSIVIPTRDRAASVLRVLEALARQSVPPDRFEVVVAADRCTDGTADRIRARRWPFTVRVVETAGGAAAARNAGAAAARGALLLFLDDDVVPEPDVVAAHVAAHGDRDRRLGIGCLVPEVQGNDFFSIALRGWWEAMIDRFREPGVRLAYRDVLTGQLSIHARRFAELGGFDPAFACHEDYEFGWRAIRSGLEIHFVAEAVGRHHDTTTLPRALARKREEGRADVRLLRKHPELAPALPLRTLRGRGAPSRGGWREPWRRRLLRRLAAGAPWAGDRVARGLQESLRVYEAVRLRQRWLTRLDDVMGYWYWRGVFEEVAESTEGARGPEIGEDALFTAIAQRRESRDDASAEGVQETAGTRTRGTERGRAEGGWSAADGRSGMVTWAPDRAGREPCSADRRDVEAEVDVASGFERAEQWIDERRPRSLLVRCGRHLVGIIADEAGAEPLRGLHLRRRLATDLAPALLRALAADGQVPAILDPDRLLATLRRSSGAHSAAA